jgi:flavin-binding protein dodecin
VPADAFVKFNSNVLVPPRKSAEVPLVLIGGSSYTYFLPYKYTSELPGASKQEVDAYRDDVLNHATSTFHNLSGFTLIDTKNNIEMAFPSWNGSTTAS